jgi:hypothetical protein
LGDLGVEVRIILREIFRKWDVDWIELAQDRNRRRTFVTGVINLRDP